MGSFENTHEAIKTMRMKCVCSVSGPVRVCIRVGDHLSENTLKRPRCFNDIATLRIQSQGSE